VGVAKQIFDFNEVRFGKWYATLSVCDCRDDNIKAEAIETELKLIKYLYVYIVNDTRSLSK
jgi:hypothetical protein